MKVNKYLKKGIISSMVFFAVVIALPCFSLTFIPSELTFDCDPNAIEASSAEKVLGRSAPTNIQTTEPVFVKPAQKVFRQAKIESSFAAEGFAQVVITLNLEAADKGIKSTSGKIDFLQQQIAAKILDLDSDLGYVYENIPAINARINSQTFEELTASPLVAAVEAVIELQLHTAQGIPLMRGDAFRDVFDGSGVSIAILDSGIDYTHQALGGGGFPNSKVIGGYDFGNNDSDPKPVMVGHGTHCAGIAAGDIVIYADYVGGVAPGAKLYALKVMPDSSGSTTSDKLTAAIDWCISHQFDDPQNPLLVISMSLGGGDYMGTCDWAMPSFTNVVNAANAAGITVLSSSGNDGFCDSMGFPACVTGVISVGAVFDDNIGMVGFCLNQWSCIGEVNPSYCAEPRKFFATTTSSAQVAPYSNSFELIDVLASAHNAYTTDIKGVTGSSVGDYYGLMGGTSAACAYAAGAAAAIQSASINTLNRPLTPTEMRDNLKNWGNPTQDIKNNITTPLIDIENSIENLDIFNGTPFEVYNDNEYPVLITQISQPQWLTVFPGAGNYGIFMTAGEKKQFHAIADCQSCDYEDASGQVAITATDGEQWFSKFMPVERVCPKGNTDITVEQIIIAGTKRLTRTDFEYDLAVKIKNNSQTAFADIALSLVAYPENFTVIDQGQLQTLYLAAGDEVICTGLLKVVIDRSYAAGTTAKWYINATSQQGTLNATVITTSDFEAFGSKGIGIAEIRKIADDWLGQGIADVIQNGIVNYEDLAILAGKTK